MQNEETGERKEERKKEKKTNIGKLETIQEINELLKIIICSRKRQVRLLSNVKLDNITTLLLNC